MLCASPSWEKTSTVTFNVRPHTVLPALSRTNFKQQILPLKKIIRVRIVEATEHISLVHSDTELTNIFTNPSTLQTAVRRLPWIFFSRYLFQDFAFC